MAPFFIILGLMSMDIPICFDNYAEFIGWKTLWHNTRVGFFIILGSVFVELVIYWMFQRVCKRCAGEASEKITVIKNQNFELMSFVTSIFLPLISFQYNQLSHWIVTAIIVCLIGYIFCHADAYYTNPTLALFRYRLYDVELDNQQANNSETRSITIIAQSVLMVGDKVRCVSMTDGVSYAKKV
ncbi:MAG: hypothetical protein J6X16_09545 [Bacteroidales bacterium]|nr:hypothetical protein [Bacteroidales bacterium]